MQAFLIIPLSVSLLLGFCDTLSPILIDIQALSLNYLLPTLKGGYPQGPAIEPFLFSYILLSNLICA